jgi:hypothetical protein
MTAYQKGVIPVFLLGCIWAFPTFGEAVSEVTPEIFEARHVCGGESGCGNRTRPELGAFLIPRRMGKHRQASPCDYL